MTEIALTFQFELLEDMHAGTGVGRLGLVDDTQSRDQQGRPVVWASTLRGLLREAGEDRLWARQQAGTNVDDDRKRMHELLGRTVESNTTDASSPGKAIVRSLRLAEGCQPKFVVWSSTAREEHSRRPNDHTLRQVEHAAAGSRFEGEIRIPRGNADDVKLLKTLLARVTALGGTRTRGWGEVQLIKLCDVTPAARPATPVSVKCLRLVLRNLEPLNLATTALAGNLIGGQSYIPGTRLRAALLHWLSDRGETTLADELAGTMSVGNAYIVPGEPEAVDPNAVVVPLPLSVHQPKGGQGEPAPDRLPWWAREANNGPGLAKPHERDGVACPIPKADQKDKCEKLYPDRQDYKRVKTEDYALRESDTCWRRVRPKMGVLLRNMVPTSRRDGPSQRAEARTETAALFSEQVIWEDQCFVAELRFDSEELAKRWQTAAAALIGGDIKSRSWLRVGRGGRPVVVEKCEAATPTPFPKQDGHLTLTLTSDLIARTPWLTFLTDLNADDLARLIEEAEPGSKPTVELQKPSYSESIEVYGFNSATGLPRAAALAIKRGSVFRLNGDKTAIEGWRAALKGVPALGERTLDGFGRFVLDLPLHEPAYWQAAEPGDAPLPTAEAVSPTEAVLKKVNDLLDSEGWNLRNKPAKQLRGREWPSITQWQWLRTTAQVATSIDDELDRLVTHAGKLAGLRWGKYPGEIRDVVKQFATEGEKKLFLAHLAQAVVAQMRRKRRSMEDRT